MAMDVQQALEDDKAELNTEINTTPLVDVMLVMLVIFLLTIPVVVQNVNVNLPNYRNIVTETKPENIVIAVDRDAALLAGLPETVALDLTDRAAVSVLADRTGQVDILVNAAGVVHAADALACTIEDWDAAIADGGL